MVHQAIDCRRRRHRILEDAFPFGKRKIARQQNAATLVTLGQKREQHLHFLAALLDVADVVDHDCLKPRQTSQHLA